MVQFWGVPFFWKEKERPFCRNPAKKMQISRFSLSKTGEKCDIIGSGFQTV